MLGRLFELFEGPCNPWPLAVFRIAFYAAVALHAVPAILFADENFGTGALRMPLWDTELYVLGATLDSAYCAPCFSRVSR